MRYRYRNDEELKDSGVEWIGKIPKDWEIIKLKHKCTFLNGYAFKSEDLDINNDVPVVRIGDINENGIDLYKILKVKKDLTQSLDLYEIKKGDTLIAMSGATVGKAMFMLKSNGELINQRVGIIRPKNINQKYLHYSINNTKFKNEILISSVGGAQENISSENIKDKHTMKFDIKEQEKIANFLDEKTSQFNLIISKKEKLIERLEEAKKSLISEVVTGKVKVVKADDGYELIKRSSEEMKDSGVEWLGKIPKEFTTSKVKYVSDVIDPQPDHRAPKIAEGVGFPYIGIRDLNEDGTINIETARKVEEEAIIKQEKAFKINKGDIVFCKVGTLGLPKFIKNHTRIALSATLVLIKSKDNIINEYLRYVLDSDCVDRQIDYVAQGSTRPSLGIQQIRKFDIPYTNIKEQKDIVTYLNYSIKSIENIIKNTKKQIEKLKEAKQSLISEAVTGKIEILD